jgi:putative glycosyltransferase (TIGR04372 family)
MSYRIGHFAANAEVYLCERDAGIHGKHAFDIFYHQPPVCNLQLKKMWDRTLHVSRLVGLPDRLNRWLPGGHSHEIPWRHYQARDIYGLLAHTRSHICFTDKEELLGRQAMLELGIPEGAEFICFLGRDPSYLETKGQKNSWDYHSFRNSSIHSYIPAAEEMVRRGYYAIRMGSVVKEPLTVTNPKIIDYAAKGRTDFLDIYLSAKCKFYISCGTGLDSVASILRRPVAFVNYVPLDWTASWDPTHVMIPKKLWLRKEQRFITFREILSSPVGLFRSAAQYEEMGIDLQDNTPEEIVAVAVEMDERINGTWHGEEEDEDLQSQFWSLFQPSPRHGDFVAHIGAQFIRQNRGLLDTSLTRQL